MHTKKQIAQIAASIRAFDLLTDTGRPLKAILAMVAFAPKRLGWQSSSGRTLVGLSEAQKKALRLADNKIALNGWILKYRRAASSNAELDIDLTGFSTRDRWCLPIAKTPMMK
jgi:hypothetical protein